MLPPSLFPNAPVDTIDQRYLNFSFAPIVSPSKNLLQIELYNKTFFESTSKDITSPTIDQASCRVDELALKEHHVQSSITSATSLLYDSNTPIPALETVIHTPLNDLSDTVDLPNKLFLI